MADSQAKFTINGTPSEDPSTGDRIFIATNSQVLSITLEDNPSAALSVLYELIDASDNKAPLASKNAPALTWNENSLTKITLGPTPTGINDTVTVTMPGSGIHSYFIRATVATPGDGSPLSQNQVFTRAIIIFSTLVTPSIRKTVPGETTEARARAWSDSQNDVVDAIENLTVGGASSNLLSGIGQFTTPSAVSVGDLVFITGSNTADRADNAGIATMGAVGVVQAKPSSTTATIIYAGQAPGLSGMTPGATQFVGSLGGHIEAGALPTTPGSVIQQVGVAETATTLILQPKQVIVL